MRELLRGKNHFKNVHVFLDSFRDFTPIEREFISIIMESCKGLYLSILSNNLIDIGDKEHGDRIDSFRVVKDNALHILSDAKKVNLPVASPVKFLEYHRFQSKELEWLADSLTELSPDPYEGDCNAVHFYVSTY